jgi:hypothetical protein
MGNGSVLYETYTFIPKKLRCAVPLEPMVPMLSQRLQSAEGSGDDLAAEAVTTSLAKFPGGLGGGRCYKWALVIQIVRVTLPVLARYPQGSALTCSCLETA